MKKANYSSVLTSAVLLVAVVTQVQSIASEVVFRGISPASNTYKAFSNASIARDSQLNRPLDLLDDFYPSIDLTISDHDNVRRRSDVSENDLRIVASPAIAYRSSVGRHPFYIAYTGTFTFYDELEVEDSEAHNVEAQLSLDLTQLWDVDLFASVGRGFEERGVSGTSGFSAETGAGSFGRIDLGLDQYDYRSYGADLVYGRDTDPITAVLGIERSESKYKQLITNSALLGSRNRDTDSIHLDIDYKLARNTSIFGRLQYSETSYHNNRNLDNEQRDWLLGLRWRPENRLSGVVAIGESEREFRDINKTAYDGSTYYGNLVYDITPYSIVSLAASKVVEEPTDLFSDYYESRLLGAQWAHALTDALSFGVSIKWIDDDYSNGRHDEFTDVYVNLDYVWRSWLKAGLFYGEIDRKSNLSNVTYSDSYFGLRLTSDLRDLFSKRRNDKYLEPYSFESNRIQRERYRKDRVQATSASGRSQDN